MTTLVAIGRFALSESERRSATLSAKNRDVELVERHRQGDASAFLEIVDT